MSRNLLILLLFLYNLNGFSQAEKRKTNNVWLSMSGQFFLKDSSLLFLENNYRFDDFNNSFSDQGIGSHLYRYHWHGGIEYAATKHWRPGFSLKYAKYPSNHDVYFKPSIQHWGKIGSVRFIKDLSFEWISKSKNVNPGNVNNDEIRWSLRGVLEKDWWLRDHLFRFGIFYRVFIISTVSNDEEQTNPYTAFIDKTRLQLYADVEVVKSIFLKLYFMKETDYYLLFDDSAFNQIRNIFGVELKYVLY